MAPALFQFDAGEVVQFQGGDAGDGGLLHFVEDLAADLPGAPHQLDLERLLMMMGIGAEIADRYRVAA